MFTNTGTKTLHGVTVVDTLTTLTCVPATPVATLAPGGTVTCTGTGPLATQADIDNNGNPNPDGFIHNVATGDSYDTDPQDSFTDTPIAVPDVVGQIMPTATTCQQFSTDTAADLEVLEVLVEGEPGDDQPGQPWCPLLLG